MVKKGLIGLLVMGLMVSGLFVLSIPGASSDLFVQARLDILKEKGDLEIVKDLKEEGIRYWYRGSIGYFRKYQPIEDEVVRERLKEKGYVEILGVIEKPYLSEYISIATTTGKNEETEFTINAQDGQVWSVLKRGKESLGVVIGRNGRIVYSSDYSKTEKFLEEGKIWYSRALIQLGIDTLKGFKKAHLLKRKEIH